MYKESLSIDSGTCILYPPASVLHQLPVGLPPPPPPRLQPVLCKAKDGVGGEDDCV